MAEEGVLAPVSTPPGPEQGLVICVDFGSTFTKASLVDVTAGTIVAAAEHRTTIDTDVLDAYDACLAALREQDPRASDAPTLACSSAGGGLRIAVVGNEELVTAEAGRRVALSSGGKVVAVFAASRGDDLGEIPGCEPDVVLLTGGTDGGNREPILACARALATTWQGPVVVAGNVDAQADVAEILAHHPLVVAPNIVPRIGVLAPEGARTAIRELFLSHVIGGKHLSSRDDFLAMVQGATPDVVLTGVELLADVAGDTVVVDVGGATTDVHSVVELDPEDAGLSREVVATTRVTRTVEGDLGMRWSAVTTVEAAGRADLTEAAVRRRADVGFVPHDDAECDLDEQIAREAVGLALRRHAGRSKVVVSPEGRVVERSGKDLREVDLLVGSGGVLRHGRPGVADRIFAGSVDEVEGGWQLPRRADVTVDANYVLAAAGLLAAEHRDAARRLVGRLAEGRTPRVTP
ncbi:glutamate mutase L [Nocardioides sp.]|uniref:glutamate mutase L n=1 Tax=Nocardioides sp. TaxID=35761 RepID=UPI002F3FDAD3